ncbi:MAG: HAMP domain-containing protein [Chloroflexi bacterium]|nr:HAMP domain-containing protein [Chloroflexota bacterium]
MKMKISTRLAIGFAAMLLLVIVTAGMAIVSLNRIGESTDVMVQQARQSAALSSIRGGVQRVESNLLVTCEKPSEQGRSNVRLLLATVNGEITDFEHPMRPEGVSMAQFLTGNPEATESCAGHCHGNASALALEVEWAAFTEATQGLLAQTETQVVNMPTARTYVETVTDDVLLAIDKLEQVQLVYLPEARLGVLEIEASTRQLMFAAAILAAVVGAVLAIVITRSITIPLANLVKVSDKISTGELDTPVPVAAKDEIGELAESMERMRISIKALVERMRSRSGG